MTLVLKSDRPSLANVGNVHDYYGAPDYVAMLDFNRGEYFTILGGSRTDYSLSDAVVTTRSTPGEYVDRKGITRIAEANQSRIHYMEDMGLAGLLGEQGRQNYVTTPVNPPPSQTVNIGATSTATRLIVSVWGSGDVNLVSPSVTRIAEVATPFGKVIGYNKSVGAAFSVELTVSGSVQRVQIEPGGTAPAGTTFHIGASGDEVSFLKAPFKDLFASGVGTILGHYVRQNSPAVTANFTTGTMSLHRVGTEYGGVYHHATTPRTSGNATDGAYSAIDGTPANSSTARVTLNGGYTRSYVTGIGFSGLGETIRLLANRQSERATGITATFSAPDKIGLLGGSGASSNSAIACAILTRLVMYDRLLDADEAHRAATQWLV